MTAFEITSVLLALLGLLGGVVGFIRAVAADRRSAAAASAAADARADATAALKQSAAATERIAVAVELLASQSAPEGLLADHTPARLAELMGPREVVWTLERRRPAHSYRLRNMGSIAAADVSLLGGSPDADTPLARIGPGTAITFDIDPERHSRAIEVSWRDEHADTRTRLALPLRSASEPAGQT